MVKKCCVYGCSTNYLSQKRKRKANDTTNSSGDYGTKPSVYRFLNNPSARDEWRKVIPNANLKVTNDTVICSLHWPPNFAKSEKNGKLRPKNKPSVWPNVPSSQIPTVPAPERSTTKSSSATRNMQPDELATFIECDKVEFAKVKDCIESGQRTFGTKVVTFSIAGTVFVQSEKYDNGIAEFVVKIFEDLRFETFHFGVKCYISSLSKNRIIKLDSWSKIEEVVRFLSAMELNNKKLF